jgi:hypothetical protein
VKNTQTYMNNSYGYDAVNNVVGITNSAAFLPRKGASFAVSHSYHYDNLYRLTSATGTVSGTGGSSALTSNYSLSMTYDNLHNITGKVQTLNQGSVPICVSECLLRLVSLVVQIYRFFFSLNVDYYIFDFGQSGKAFRYSGNLFSLERLDGIEDLCRGLEKRIHPPVETVSDPCRFWANTFDNRTCPWRSCPSRPARTLRWA